MAADSLFWSFSSQDYSVHYSRCIAVTEHGRFFVASLSFHTTCLARYISFLDKAEFCLGEIFTGCFTNLKLRFGVIINRRIERF